MKRTLIVIAIATAMVWGLPFLAESYKPTTAAAAVSEAITESGKAETEAKTAVVGELQHANKLAEEARELTENPISDRDQVSAEVQKIKAKAADLAEANREWEKAFSEYKRKGNDGFTAWQASIEKIPEKRYQLAEQSRHDKAVEAWNEKIDECETSMAEVKQALTRFESLKMIMESVEWSMVMGDLTSSVADLSLKAHTRANSFLADSEQTLARLTQSEPEIKIAAVK